MGAVVEIVLPVFALVLCGWGFGRGGLLPAGGGRAIGAFVFNLAIPALLFRAMARGLPEIGAAGGLVAAFFSGCLVMYAAAWILGRVVFGLKPAERAVMGMACAFANIVMMGLPLIALAYGDRGLVPAVIVVAFHSPLLIGGTTLAVELLRDGRGAGRAFVDAMRAVLRNPIILGLAAGAIWGALGFALPAPLARFVDLLAGAAAPAALFALGAALVDFRLRGAWGETLTITALKLVGHPLAVWLLARFVFTLPPLWTEIAVLAAAFPVGANVFLLAQRHDVYTERSASAVLVSTALSIFTIGALVALLRL